ncbi:MAG: HD domain-containing protein [Kiritimatiellae bacterium]|nr:HD domain-containing protein [Kiritimatiellia bacterium]MBR1589448.1 HD domain-containing protein [Kiritimatiellia bacterium]
MDAYVQTVSDVRDGLPWRGWLLVKDSGVRAAANGKKFLDLHLVDRTGSVQAKVWDFSGEPPPVGAVVKVEASGNAYNGHLQLKVSRFREARPEDAKNPADYVPAAPDKPETMLEEVLATARELRDGSLRGIVLRLLEKAGAGGALLTAPAAKSMHHAELGGLLHHTTTMLRAAKALCGVYRFLDKDLLYAGVIVHDLGKLSEMRSGSLGLVEEYTADGRLVGHIVRCVADIELAAAECGASRERATLLQHMVLSHHGDAQFGSPVPPKCAEAEALSMIDRLDAKLFQMQAAVRGVEPGGFSPPVWGLDKVEVYRPA